MFESFGVLQYATYFWAVVLIILLPGPNSVYVLALSAQHGAKKGWAAAAAIFVGDLILMLLTAFGAATVLTQFPIIFNTLKLLGALYLLYIGLRLIMGAVETWRNKNNNGLTLPKTKDLSCKKAFNKALLISLLNPKAILFFLSFFVQFVDPNYPNPALPFAVLIVTLQLASFVYLATLIYIGEKLANTLGKYKFVKTTSNGTVGTVFIAFAIKLALASAG